MSSTITQTESYSYTEVDVENVVRRFTTDILMIAASTGAISENEARDYGHDVEILAKAGYLEAVDVTLLSSGSEVRAVNYSVITGSGDLAASRSGGVRWPKVVDPFLRVVLRHTPAYTPDLQAKYSPRLNINWSPSRADTSHGGLTGTSGRDYSSNGFGMTRKDYQ